MQLQKLIIIGFFSFFCSSSVLFGQEKVMEAPHSNQTSESSSGVFFPSWNAPSLGVDLSTVGGIAHSSRFGEEGFNDDVSGELGLSARIRNLPMIPGLLYGTAHFLYARGLRRAALFSLSEKNQLFNRYWGGGGVTVLWNHFKNAFSISLGSIDFDDKSLTDSKLFIIENDFGIKLLPLISQHLAFNYQRFYTEEYREPSADDTNFWLYTAIKVDFMIDLDFRVGPGVRYVQTYDQQQEVTNKGTATYLKSFLDVSIFGPLVADGSAYYVFNDDIHLSGIRDNADRLPNQDIQSSSSDEFLSRDTLDLSFFAGVRGLINGLNVGWRYNMRIKNALEREDKNREFSRYSGFEFNYKLSL